MTFEAENQFFYALICFSLGVFARALGYLLQAPFSFFYCGISGKSGEYGVIGVNQKNDKNGTIGTDIIGARKSGGDIIGTIKSEKSHAGKINLSEQIFRIINAAGYFLMAVAAFFVFAIGKNYYDLPSLRAYMLLAFFTGFLLLSKICDKKIDFLLSKLYNRLVKTLRKPKKYENRQAEKNSRLGNGGSRSVAGDIAVDNGLSDSLYKGKRKGNKRTGKRNRTLGKTKRANRG